MRRVRPALAWMLLVLVVAGLAAGGAQAAHVMPGGPSATVAVDLPDCDDCPGDQGPMSSCSLACAAGAAQDLALVVAGVSFGPRASAEPAAVFSGLPPGAALAPDPPRPKSRPV